MQYPVLGENEPSPRMIPVYQQLCVDKHPSALSRKGFVEVRSKHTSSEPAKSNGPFPVAVRQHLIVNKTRERFVAFQRRAKKPREQWEIVRLTLCGVREHEMGSCDTSGCVRGRMNKGRQGGCDELWNRHFFDPENDVRRRQALANMRSSLKRASEISQTLTIQQANVDGIRRSTESKSGGIETLANSVAGNTLLSQFCTNMFTFSL
jgi:hypothetical protein